MKLKMAELPKHQPFANSTFSLGAKKL